jgi:Zn-dependent peptidase ImmA (M78 family)
MTDLTRAEQALVFICSYAQDNNGVTPSSEEIARELGVSQQRAYYILNRLVVLNKIQWVTRYKYLVINSVWEPPEEVEV